MQRNPKILALIFLDLAWSLCAFLYDWPALVTIPFWAWPFIAICPLYPLLLAAFWIVTSMRKTAPALLASFASIPSAAYGVLSLIFYPLCFFYLPNGALGLLQIPWVWMYALQGFWIIRHVKLGKSAYLAAMFISLCFTIQFITHTYGYLAVGSLPYFLQILLYVLGLVTVVGITLKNTRYIDTRSS